MQKSTSLSYTSRDLSYMRRVYEIARHSAQAGFDPFGALLVRADTIVATSIDRCIQYSDPTAHAELVLISEYCREHRLIDLAGYTLYCNVEPCIMCSGAIHWARLSRVVFGVSQPQLQAVSGGNPKPACAELINSGGTPAAVTGPVLPTEGIALLREFPFSSKKQKHRQYWIDR